MTELDKALQKGFEDESQQNKYYELVLNTSFYIPTMPEETDSEGTELRENDSFAPVILESEGKPYMMLFDSEERLTAWAQESVTYVRFTGDVLAQMTPPTLHWAVNVGTDFAKEFLPDEIAWLKDVITNSTEPEKE